MLRLFLLILGLWSSHLLAQEAPASPLLMTIGPIDGESDGKNSIVTVRYDTKPGFEKPRVEAHGSFLQVILPQTLVPRPGQFIQANSPYIRKMAAFQIDETTAGLRLFVTREAAELLPALTTDILENRVLVMLDHGIAEKNSAVHFEGAPVTGGPSPEEIVERTAVRSDIPDPVAASKAAAPGVPASAEQNQLSAKAAPAASAEAPAWAEGLDQKLVAVTIFVAVMLLLLVALKSWRGLASKKWPLPAAADVSLKTLASHNLGPKQKITVVQVGQEQILLGVSPDQISFLTSLKKAEAPLGGLTLDPVLAAQRVQQALPKRPPTLDEVLPKASQKKTAPTEKKPEPGSSIAYGISDQGVKNYKGSSQAQARASSSDSDAVDDVTKLIRKKLRDLPKV